MSLRTFVVTAVSAAFLTACAATPPGSQAPAGVLPQSSHRSLSSRAFPAAICYGTLGVEVMPCPAKLNRKNGGTVTVSVEGPSVAFVVPIASDCIGPGSVCNLSRNGSAPNQFVVSSVRGQNICGTAWVVFEGLTASGGGIGTATLTVVNRYC